MLPVAPYLRGRGQSFFYAGAGILRLIREEKNAQIHLLATVLVVVVGMWVKVSVIEWAVLVLTIVTVLAAEATNSALERVADVVSPGQNPMIGAAKDLAAAGVLIVAIGAVVIAALVFGPHFMT